MEQMDAWSSSVDERLRSLLDRIDDGEAIGDVMAALAEARPLVLETLTTYPGVPDAETLRRTATHTEVLRALMGVWSAANPLVVTLVETLVAMTQAQTTVGGDVSELMSTLRRTSDGPSDESGESSPTENSSSDSTPLASDSTTSRNGTPNPRASASSSRRTSRRTGSGSAASTEPLAAHARASLGRR